MTTTSVSLARVSVERRYARRRAAEGWQIPARIVAVVVLVFLLGYVVAIKRIESAAETEIARPERAQRAPAQARPDGTGRRTRPAPTRQQRPTPGGAIATWPGGRSAWTAILLSTDSRVRARRAARQAIARGIPAGVLRSNDHPGLNPGFWVVFAGQLESRRAAEAQAGLYAERGFRHSYTRFVNAAP